MQFFRRWIPAALCLALPLLLTACGDLPEPFLGNPGATARRLAQPPTPRLAVPPMGNMLLPDAASQLQFEQRGKDLSRAKFSIHSLDQLVELSGLVGPEPVENPALVV